MNKRFGLVFVVSMVLGGCSAPLADFNSGDGGSNADAAVVPVGDASGSCTMVPGACGVGNRCDNGRCVAGCGADGDCNAGQVCNTQTRVCVASDGGVASDASVVCSEGQTRCNGACVNCQTNAMHCGTCGHVCNAGQSCVAGICTGGNPGCGDGQTTCSGACVNTQTNASHCGGCGRACNAGQTCVAGACTGGSPTCTGSGETYCSGACVNTNTNASHCGGCGRVCSSGQVCASGSCVTADGGMGSGTGTVESFSIEVVNAGSIPGGSACQTATRIVAWDPVGNENGPRYPYTATGLATASPAWLGYVNFNNTCGSTYNRGWAGNGVATDAFRVTVRYTDGTTIVAPVRVCADGDRGSKPRFRLDGGNPC